VAIALLERFGGNAVTVFLTLMSFERKSVAKHVAKYQLFQTAMEQILMSTIKDFLKIFSAGGPNSALSTGALNPLLKL
jgi:hypothetical protein